MKLSLDTLVFAIVMAILVFLYIEGGFIKTFSTINSVIVGGLLLFFVIVFWLLHKEPKTKQGGVR